MEEGAFYPPYFTPISIDEFVQLSLKDNPDLNEDEFRNALKYAVSLKMEGVKCTGYCGNPIWAIGTALAGSPMCFSCITGEALPDDDYEIGSVC